MKLIRVLQILVIALFVLLAVLTLWLAHQQVTTEKKPVPLSCLLNQEKRWVVKSNFENVGGTNSLLAAEAHKPGDREVVHQLVFLDSRGCEGAVLSVPNIGDNIDVRLVGVRIDGRTNTIHPSPIHVMVFVQPQCR
jgi:hypothetical protein